MSTCFTTKYSISASILYIYTISHFFVYILYINTLLSIFILLHCFHCKYIQHITCCTRYKAFKDLVKPWSIVTRHFSHSQKGVPVPVEWDSNFLLLMQHAIMQVLVQYINVLYCIILYQLSKCFSCNTSTYNFKQNIP